MKKIRQLLCKKNAEKQNPVATKGKLLKQNAFHSSHLVSIIVTVTALEAGH